MRDKSASPRQAANRTTLRKLNLSESRVLFRFDNLKMKNAIYPVCRDTQLPHSSIRFSRFFLPACEFSDQTDPTLRQTLFLQTMTDSVHLEITAANKAIQFIALAARTIP
jgi:hypothetical protein